MKGEHPRIDAAIMQTVRAWKYRPYRLQGRLVPFCTTVRFTLQAS
jgi:hypothetical protein